MYRVWIKEHILYGWFKYNVYKPIRWLSESIRYGYWMSEEAQEESKRLWIRRLKDETVE